MNKSTLRAIQGGILALGAPIGWLTIRAFDVPNLLDEVVANSLLYGYLLFATEIVFISFGNYVGRKEDLISDLAIRDGLTGIYNLRFYMERLKEQVANAKRYKEPLCLVYFDIDHFKHINDRYGHPIGDEVLKALTQLVSTMTREPDVFARVGGEEFALLLTRCLLKDALARAEKIRIAIETNQIETHTHGNLGITVSLGVVELKKDEEIDQFYDRADHNLYLAKQQGRNQTVG